MKVCIVKWQNPEDSFTFGVFSTEEMAKTVLKKHLKHIEKTHDEETFADYVMWFLTEVVTLDEVLVNDLDM